MKKNFYYMHYIGSLEGYFTNEKDAIEHFIKILKEDINKKNNIEIKKYSKLNWEQKVLRNGKAI